MASYTLSRNLKLRLDSNLTANASYNLSRIDALAAVYLLDNTESVNIRSKESITLRPADSSVGGEGTGGTVNISVADQPLDAFNVYADELNLSGQLALDDQSAAGTRRLKLKYASALSGSVDTSADRTLSLDLQGADRSLILGGSLTVAGGSLTATLTADTDVTFPTAGTLATRAGSETLTNKTIDADGPNTISNLRSANLAADAAIPYSKLLLTGSLLNADISSSAAIAGTKIDPAFGAQIISTSDRLRLNGASFRTDLLPAASGQVADLSLKLPPNTGSVGQTLTSDGSGNTSWTTPVGTGTVLSVGLSLPDVFMVTGSPVTDSGTLTASLDTQQANTVWAGPTVGADAAPAFRALVTADLPSIDHGGLAGLSDDDHAQYLNTARADTWLATKTTANLTEGANLYYTAARFNTAFSGKTSSDLGEGSNLYFTDERAQDAVGTILADSSSVNFTYTDATPEITAVVLPAGVDHDSLLNYSANKHIDHSSVSIATSSVSGLSGGGTIASTRNILVAPDLATAATPATGDLLLFADVSATNALKNATVGELLAVGGYATDWTSGTTKTVTHSLGTRDVLVELYDNTTFETVIVDSVIRTDTNTVDLTSNAAPSGSGLRVLVRKV